MGKGYNVAIVLNKVHRGTDYKKAKKDILFNLTKEGVDYIPPDGETVASFNDSYADKVEGIINDLGLLPDECFLQYRW